MRKYAQPKNEKYPASALSIEIKYHEYAICMGYASISDRQCAEAEQNNAHIK